MYNKNIPFIRKRHVYYDLEAYFSYNHSTGVEDKPNPKYRIFYKEILGFFTFFFTTTSNYSEMQYEPIYKSDWVWKKPYHLLEESRVEVRDCCKLTSVEIKEKQRRNKIYIAGKVNQCLIDRIKKVYENQKMVYPKKLRPGNIPLEVVFAEKCEVEKIARKLGIIK